MEYCYEFQTLRERYQDFSLPMAKLVVNEKDLAEKRETFLISELEVELSSGMEASALFFKIYNCYDEKEKKYKIKEVKKYILLGTSVVLSLGYGGDLTEVFKGFIANVSFVGQEGEAPHMEVTALDVKGIMMANSYARQMLAANYSDAIKELFEKSVYQKMFSYGIYTNLKVMDTPDKMEQVAKPRIEYIDMVSESDYDFVVKAAKRFNYEFFVENGVIHFRKAKDSAVKLIQLSQEKGILHYEISYDITGLVETIETRGSDIYHGQEIITKKKVKNKISLGNKAKSLLSKTEKIYIDGGIHSKEQAEYRTNSLVEEMSYRFGTIECECVGIPEIRPGNFIETQDFAEPADNLFYITHVKHRLDNAGVFMTELKGKAAALKG